MKFDMLRDIAGLRLSPTRQRKLQKPRSDDLQECHDKLNRFSGSNELGFNIKTHGTVFSLGTTLKNLNASRAANVTAFGCMALVSFRTSSIEKAHCGPKITSAN